MCGILGYLGSPPAEELEVLRDRLSHRGPDDGGIWTAPGIGLAHRRLSILDLSPEGHQPMSRGPLHLVYNGEIYNFQELRQQLEASGHTFRGHSDTEVLLAGFLQWGVEATLQISNGMFALALWNENDRTLTLARDRYGKKPLYYGWQSQAWHFASELKALHRPGLEIDRGALTAYFRYGYVPAPQSIYQGVFKLPPGHLVVLDEERRQVSPVRYWTLPEPNDTPATPEELEEALLQSVRLRMLSDVPLGAFLSGGIDSSLVVALMQRLSPRPVQTFCIGFREAGYDESGYAREVARQLGTEHHELRVSAEEALSVVPKLAQIYDEPFADSSQIPTYLVSRLARQTVTVALSGDGGDEIFGGYNRYLWGPRIWRSLRPIPLSWRRLLFELLSRLPLALVRRLPLGIPYPEEKLNKLLQLLPLRSPQELYLSLVSQWADPAALVPGGSELSWSSPFDLSTAEGMMKMDALTYLPDDILVKVDRASMAVSLECRAPLLDYKVAEIAARLPRDQRIRAGQGKWVLREILKSYVQLPERPKSGFSLPLGTWLRGPLRDWAHDLLAPQNLQELDFKPIQERWQQHLSGHRDWSASLWTVLMFQAWQREWCTA